MSPERKTPNYFSETGWAVRKDGIKRADSRKEGTGSMESPERMEMRPGNSSVFELEALESESKAGSDSDCSSNSCHLFRVCQTNQHSEVLHI